jgi:hypothetical protein
MYGRVAITVTAWLAGVLFFFMLNGQVFDHSLQLLGCAVVAALPWVSLVSGRQGRSRRSAAIALLGLSALVIVAVSVQLPAAREAQTRFNERLFSPTRWEPIRQGVTEP